jgi:hypothetical protein
MSRKLLVFCFLFTFGGLGSLEAAEVNDGASKVNPGPARRPLDKAKAVLNRNAQEQPQSQGLENAVERVNANQERFIEKHFDGPSAASDRVERMEKVDKPERPADRPERPDVARPDISRGPGVDRPDRSASKNR